MNDTGGGSYGTQPLVATRCALCLSPEGAYSTLTESLAVVSFISFNSVSSVNLSELEFLMIMLFVVRQSTLLVGSIGTLTAPARILLLLISY